jgi:cell division protein FtsA
VEELFDLVDKELRAVDRSASLPAGIVLTGGGAKMAGLSEIAKARLRLPAFIGKPLLSASHIEKIDDPRYTTALGLVYYALQGSNKAGSLMPNFSSVKLATDRMTKWFKDLLP